ncbi:xre family toxin-antitoxin system, antitoxin component [Streptomyces himastatinicus ATCC 53653]|uniref:Xre family toxin-antitoxin system, antitoxin component n=1 Tax=Streptomyces himastatinicus ATCC 53653 TaxID=457427 RepID=D9W8I1_9ACTN|nr:xre family toxin-antitoxin system, antitoxin component [Streptomyces himastatinicus ATCC 53653]
MRSGGAPRGGLHRRWPAMAEESVSTDGGSEPGEVPASLCGGEPETSGSLRTFGAVVEALREHVGLSRAEFAELVRFSKHTVASVEQGRRMPDPSLVERAEEALGNTGAAREAARHLCRQPGLAAWFRQWARLERVAISLYTYECPGGAGPVADRGIRAGSVAERPRPVPDEAEDGPSASPPGSHDRSCCPPAVSRRRCSTSSSNRRCWNGTRVARTSRGSCWIICWTWTSGTGTWSCRSCRCGSRCALGWTVPCSCWRPPSTAGSGTPKGRRTAA